MRVVLVDNLLIEQNGTRVETVLQPHLGLISLLAVLRAEGHDGVLYDPKLALSDGRLDLDARLYRQIARQVVALEPDVVGLTSLGCNFICTLKVAQHVRILAPGVTILLGGPHATILDRAILDRYDAFDAILRHEAEATLPRVLAGLGRRALGGIDGVTYRDGATVVVNPGAPLVDDLDQLPIPSYEHYPVERLQLEWLRVEAGRGCPFMCTFCSTASFFGRQYRLKSAPRLCGELDALHARYGVRQFSLQHDLFTVNRDKVLAFCDAVGSRGYIWKCSARMDCVDAELLRAMAAAGCREIYFGVETGSPRLQQLAEKRLDLTLFYPTLAAADAVGIQPTVSFITGYPQEDAADQAATLDLIGSCFYLRPPPANVQLHLMTPEPGTELLTQFGDQLAFDGFISDFTFPTLEPDDPAVIAAAPGVFMNNHYFNAVLPRRRHVLVSTLYYALYDLSPPVLAYLLDQFDGRLSALVDGFDAWAAPRGLAVADLAAVVEFATERWGAMHHLTSLVRYMAALGSMARPSRRRVIGAPPPPTTRASRDAYVLNPAARILRAIHDCSALLAELEPRHDARSPKPRAAVAASALGATGLVSLHPRRGAAPRHVLAAQIAASWDGLVQHHDAVTLPTIDDTLGDFLVVPVAGSDQVRNLRLDPRALELLELFRRPRSLRELRRAGGGVDASALIDDLIRLEIVTAVVAAPRRSGRAVAIATAP